MRPELLSVLQASQIRGCFSFQSLRSKKCGMKANRSALSILSDCVCALTIHKHSLALHTQACHACIRSPCSQLRPKWQNKHAQRYCRKELPGAFGPRFYLKKCVRSHGTFPKVLATTAFMAVRTRMWTSHFSRATCHFAPVGTLSSKQTRHCHHLAFFLPGSANPHPSMQLNQLPPGWAMGTQS